MLWQQPNCVLQYHVLILPGQMMKPHCTNSALTAGIVLQLHRLSLRVVLPPASAAYTSRAEYRAQARDKLSTGVKWQSPTRFPETSWFTAAETMAPAMFKIWDRLSLDTKEYALGHCETSAACTQGAKRFPRFSVGHVQAHIVHRVRAGSPDTQTQNMLPGMCQGEEEISKSLHFYWKLCASPPTYSAVCTPRNQHCLNLWYFNKPSCQAKDALRHITFVQRRIPAAVKSRECELCCKPTHRYVKRVLLKITALCTAWSGTGHRLFRECTWEWQIATKNPFTVHRGKWDSTNECLFFIS